MSSHRILVVDDHRDTANTFARLLRAYGHIGIPAYSFADAEAKCAEDKFDLVVTDIELLDGNGIELFGRLREQCGVSGVIVSGHSDPDLIRQVEEMGDAEFLLKPIQIEKLMGAVDRALVGRNASPAPPDGHRGSASI